MAPVSHQTIRLSRGRHLSPQEGACVMELASMLAGEKFTDHPASVCPVIASFLRAYNDAIDEDRRQHLYEYASRVVGSRGSAELQEARAARLHDWTLAHRRSRLRRVLLRFLLLGMSLDSSADLIGILAVSSMGSHDDASHAAALALVDELLAMGRPETAPAAPRGEPAPDRLRSISTLSRS